MAFKIQLRRGTAAQWTAANPILAAGELGLETDTKLFKAGDGTTPWNTLEYGALAGDLANGSVTESKIATSAVTQTKIADNAVTQAKLASNLSGITVCTSSTRPGSPFEGQSIYETDTDLVRSWNGTSWVSIGPATPTPQYPALEAYGVASGGTSSSVTVGGVNYTLLTFTSNANLVVSTAGWFDFVFVGGGGGGGSGVNSAQWSFGNQAGSGGGAGETVFISKYVPAGTYPVVIGSGGSTRACGSNTRIAALDVMALGGGPGSNAPNADAGSGGGGPSYGAFALQAPGRGFAGAPYSGGNGGGGGGMGGPASGTTGGAGFDISVWIGGSTTLKSAGGTGGSNGGAGAAAAANSGSGGGGGGYGTNPGGAGGAGGSGVAYVRFRV
jgi:hypothetical protein